MNNFFKNEIFKRPIGKPVLATVCLLMIISLGYISFKFYKENLNLKTQTKNLEERLKQAEIESAQKEEEKNTLSNSLLKERERNNEFEEEFNKITNTVDRLDKLSKTDKELLQKYSKVYFLNENYIPDHLMEIDSQYINEKNKKIETHAQVYPFLEDMIESAKEDGINLLLISGYRSFKTQAGLKSAYSIQYGKGANTFSADQGFSEHQLGTTFDLTTKELGINYAKIETTEAFSWLNKNAYKFGFILSYPKDNKFYVFEPWHWRFVGTSLAETLKEDNRYFYDLDQRYIDTFLISIFD